MSKKTFEQISEETAMYFATQEIKKLQTKVAVLEKVIIETKVFLEIVVSKEPYSYAGRYVVAKDLLFRIQEYVNSHMVQ